MHDQIFKYMSNGLINFNRQFKKKSNNKIKSVIMLTRIKFQLNFYSHN